MTLPTLIDVAIGLVLMFFLLSTLGSILAELVAGHQKWRHQLLRETVTRLLEPDTARKFWAHSLIQPLFGSSVAKSKPSPVPDPTPTTSPASGQSSPMPTVARVLLAPIHPLGRGLKGLEPRKAEAPAYLDADLFAETVLDIASGQGAAGRVPSTLGAWDYAIRTYVPAKPGENNDLQDRLLALLRQIPAETADITAALKTAVAKWYGEAMQRASGIYRRLTQKALLIIGCILAIALNADALRVAQVLYQNPELRKDIAQQAEQIHTDLADTSGDLQPAAPDQSTRDQLKEYTGNLRDMAKVGFPIGWMPVWRANFIHTSQTRAAAKTAAPAGHPVSAPPQGIFDRILAAFSSLGLALARFWSTVTEPGWVALLAKFCGLAASALAVCLGAPFWFDLLGRLVKLRSSAGADAEKPKPTGAPGVQAGAGAANVIAPSFPSVPASAAPALAQPLPAAADTLAAAGTDFAVARSYWLAEFASQAYQTDRAVLERWLQENEFNLTGWLDLQGTQGFLAQAEGVAVLAFRGTEQKLDDWVTDAEFKLIDGGGTGVPGRVHDGFAKALASVTPILDPLIAELKGRRVILHITGHSLGAALATLAALRYELQPDTVGLVQTVHTYGSPRVGDAAFAQAFDAKFTGRTYRFVNDEDLVTRVPPRLMDYDHVCNLVYIDAAGRIQRDIGYWYRFLNFVTNALGDLKQAVKTTVKDHSIKLYCGHLEKAARTPSSNP